MSLGSPWMLLVLVVVPALVFAYWWALRLRGGTRGPTRVRRARADRRGDGARAGGATSPSSSSRPGSLLVVLRAGPTDR